MNLTLRMYLLSAAFPLVLAASLSGWGGLVLPRSDSWTRRFGAGTLAVFAIVSTAGWSGFLSGPMLWGILAAGALALLKPGAVRLPAGAAWIGLAGLLVLPLALLPPISRDAMAHHLLLPKIWLADGAISLPAWSPFFHYPYLVETLYALCGGTVGFDSARTVSMIGFLALCAVPAEYFLRRGSRRAALLAIVILASIPELFRNATWSYSDTFLTFFSVLAYAEILREDGSPVRAVLWAGAAGCCKYNGILVLLMVAAMLPLRFRRLRARTWVACGAAALLTSAWWAVPNLLAWSNPVYPLLRGVLGPPVELTPRGADYLAAQGWFAPAITGPVDYLMLPVRMSLYGRWDDPALFDGASGPLLLAGTLVAVALVHRRRWKVLPPLLLLAAAVAMSGVGVRTRYLLPGLAMLALPAAEAVSRAIGSGGRMVRIVTGVLVAGCVTWSALQVADLYALERPLTFPGRDEYLEGSTNYHGFFTECEPFVGPGDTTLLVNIDRPFHFPGYAVTGAFRLPVELLELFWSGLPADAVRDTLLGRGVTLLAVDMVYTSLNAVPQLKGDELDCWREFAACELQPVVATGRFMLFRLREGS